MTNEIRPTHILWATHNRNHLEIAFTGSLNECEKEMEDRTDGTGYGFEIHANEIKDSWNNAVEKIHYDLYMDDSVDSRPMTSEEIAKEND